MFVCLKQSYSFIHSFLSFFLSFTRHNGSESEQFTNEKIPHQCVYVCVCVGGGGGNVHVNNFLSLLVCLFVLRLNVPVNNFSVMSGRSQRFLGLTSTVGSRCALLKDTTR